MRQSYPQGSSLAHVEVHREESSEFSHIHLSVAGYKNRLTEI